MKSLNNILLLTRMKKVVGLHEHIRKLYIYDIQILMTAVKFLKFFTNIF